MKEVFVVIVEGYVNTDGLRHIGEKDAATFDDYPSREAIEHEMVVCDARYARVERRYVLIPD